MITGLIKSFVLVFGRNIMVLFKKKDKNNLVKIKEGSNKEELRIKEPVFLRDFSKSKKQMKSLRCIMDNMKADSNKVPLQESLERIIKCQLGEEEIIKKLKKANLPIVFMHDLNLVFDGKMAELDFVILSNRFIIVLETKNFSNYLAVNRGEDSGFMHVEERELSPDSRNKRHQEFLRDIIKGELPHLQLDIRNAVVCQEKSETEGVDLSTRVLIVEELVPELEKFYDKSKFTLENKEVNDVVMSILKYNKPVSYNYVERFNLIKEDFSDESFFSEMIQEV